jgi:hypothetical protein
MNAELSKQKNPGKERFLAQIADENFNFRDVYFNDRKITGLQVAMEAGAHPVEDFVILQWLKSFELETIRPSELIDLTLPAKIFVIKGSATYKFTVDGINLEWPLSNIAGLAIKRLVGQDGKDVDLLLERENVPDQIIKDCDEVKLCREGVEHFKIIPVNISIIVNGRPKKVNKKCLSFDEIVSLAFDPVPVGPNISFTITYRRGPVSNPEGTMQPGTTIMIKNGMIFDVSATNKS